MEQVRNAERHVVGLARATQQELERYRHDPLAERQILRLGGRLDALRDVLAYMAGGSGFTGDKIVEDFMTRVDGLVDSPAGAGESVQAFRG